MIKSIDEMEAKPSIDLTGPNGNAYFLLGAVKTYGRQLGLSDDEQSDIRAEMQSGDYENLVAVFDREFGEYVDLYR